MKDNEESMRWRKRTKREEHIQKLRVEWKQDMWEEPKETQYGGGVNYWQSGDRWGWRGRERSEETGLWGPLRSLTFFWGHWKTREGLWAKRCHNQILSTVAATACDMCTLLLRGPWQKESLWVTGGKARPKDQEVASAMGARIRGGNRTLGERLRYNHRNS